MQDLPSSFEFISHMIYLDSVFLFRNNAEQQCPGRVYRRCVAEKVECLLVDKYGIIMAAIVCVKLEGAHLRVPFRNIPQYFSSGCYQQ